MISVLKTNIGLILVDIKIPYDSVYYCDVNKKALGKMKDEFNGVKINGFVGLKRKKYKEYENEKNTN